MTMPLFVRIIGAEFAGALAMSGLLILMFSTFPNTLAYVINLPYWICLLTGIILLVIATLLAHHSVQSIERGEK